ncbi:glycosyltransferase family A protein [Streptomyces sp. NPDC046909]|uniref:glycosyltransferase family 2 protein n=1 Tax=Streptomyces sp. NPDC046909 TaxID=3155617 RepID=UPI0033CAF761
MPLHAPQVCVVVTGHDDAPRVTSTVRSALTQGAAVREVLVVDDGSTDGGAELLNRLGSRDPRVRVLRRRVHSGGRGSPRNTALDRVTSPYVMFLDGGDALLPGAVDALLPGAVGALPAGGLEALPPGARVDVVSGLCARPAQRPLWAHDTACGNKLYRTGFLHEHGIRFPEGRFAHGEVVFHARVLAAGPRVTFVPKRVYVPHAPPVPDAPALAEAYRLAYDILLAAGRTELAETVRSGRPARTPPFATSRSRGVVDAVLGGLRRLIH